ncbi:hypothetical protein HPB52_014289 [Rhipicephalus sanguineus]|uniref:CCHC-type domain-containing protein n=1 Tax=Rhipicephalus sanguineus TaxID=34632 RepID=A0A9D4Q6Q4_RHISA|nr:hypothetical protein HPB52_014289 [Rhipicephalus sanguineus]
MLHTVPDDNIREALAPYGRVMDVAREKWRVLGLQDMGSSTRLVTLVPRRGLGADDVPHLLRIAGVEALVVIPGRAPLCFRCRNTGHIRRDCASPLHTLSPPRP